MQAVVIAFGGRSGIPAKYEAHAFTKKSPNPLVVCTYFNHGRYSYTSLKVKVNSKTPERASTSTSSTAARDQMNRVLE